MSVTKKLFNCTICIVILVFFVIIALNENLKSPLKAIYHSLQKTVSNDISCYSEISSADSISELNFSKEKDEEPKLGESIFFHETSCFGEEGLLLNSRQACAVESAAKMNPNMSVYLLYLSPSKVSKSAQKLIQQLSSYENIKIRRIRIEKYVKNTPLENWNTIETLKTSNWPRSHMSDILRYLTLWKYGGIYLDLDVVVTKSLDDLNNFAGAEDWEDVAAGVIGFGMGNLGRRVADDCLRDLRANFKGNVWGNNGPGVITRILQKLCDAKYARDMTPARCSGFNVFPPSAFYPINYKDWKKYFEPEGKNETMMTIRNSKAIHVWNKFSQSKKILVGSEVPYTIVARQYCPKVYNNCGKFF